MGSVYRLFARCAAPDENDIASVITIKEMSEVHWIDYESKKLMPIIVEVVEMRENKGRGKINKAHRI